MTIKDLRESQGLKQGAFADSIGVTRTAIIGYEKGKFKPSGAVVAKIKEVYGVDISTEQADTDAAPAIHEEKAKKRRTKKDAQEVVETAAPAPKKRGGRRKKEAAAAAAPVVEEAPAAPKKRGGRKKKEDAATAPKTRDGRKKQTQIIIQSPMGGNITPEEILSKIGDCDAVYIRVDENKAYYVRGEETGSINLWV